MLIKCSLNALIELINKFEHKHCSRIWSICITSKIDQVYLDNLAGFAWVARTSCFHLGLGLSRTMAHCCSGFGSVPCKLQCNVSHYLWPLLVASSPHYRTLQLGLVWQSLSYIDQWEDKTEKLDQWEERLINWPNQGLYTVNGAE